jgi:hypothetical protein
MKRMHLLILFCVVLAGVALGCAGRPPVERTLSTAELQGLRDSITTAAQQGRASVVIPPGAYHLPRTADRAYFDFTGLHDLEIDARGVTFLLSDPRKPAMLFDRCQRITLRGATFVRQQLNTSQGAITAIDAERKWLDIRIAAGYRTDLDDTTAFKIPVINLFTAATRTLKADVPDIYIASVERRGPDVFRFIPRKPMPAALPVQVGDLAAWRGTKGHDIVQFYTAGMRFLDITLRGAGGWCYSELHGDGGNTYQRCVITYGPTPVGASEPPLLASAEDGLHSAAMRRGPLVEDCHFEGLDDDGIAIHGMYALGIAAQGANAIIVDSRPAHTGPPASEFCAVGDRLRVLSHEMAIASEATVVALRHLPDYHPEVYPTVNSRRYRDQSKASYVELTLDHPVSDIAGCYVENRDGLGEGFVIRNCTLRNQRAHGMFIKSGSGLIEGNTIENTIFGGIVVAPEVDAWSEAGYAQDLVIRGNTLRRVGLGTQSWNGALTVAAFEGGKFTPLPGGHRRISIVDNRFEDCDGANVVLTSAQEVELRGNRFIRPQQQAVTIYDDAGVDRGAVLWLSECSGVRCAGNVVEAPGAAQRTVLVRGAHVSGEGLDDGFNVQSAP